MIKTYHQERCSIFELRIEGESVQYWIMSYGSKSIGWTLSFFPKEDEGFERWPPLEEIIGAPPPPFLERWLYLPEYLFTLSSFKIYKLWSSEPNQRTFIKIQFHLKEFKGSKALPIVFDLGGRYCLLPRECPSIVILSKVAILAQCIPLNPAGIIEKCKSAFPNLIWIDKKYPLRLFPSIKVIIIPLITFDSFRLVVLKCLFLSINP